VTDLLQGTRPMATVDHPLRPAAHRKPDPMLDFRSAWLAVIVAFNNVWPVIAAGAVATVVVVPGALILMGAYIQEHGVIAAMQVGAVAVEAIVITPLGWWVAAFLCDRIDAKASKNSSSSSARRRKVA
jgi:hypothetical protein